LKPCTGLPPPTHDFSAIPGEEKICVARIKLRYTELGLTGVVCGFSEADRLLSTWKAGAGIPTECEFHVAFTDGKTINGRYQLWRGTRGRPSLSALIRSCLQFRPVHYRSMPYDKAMELVDEYGRQINATILWHYEIPK
jgi:hypothetical protein